MCTFSRTAEMKETSSKMFQSVIFNRENYRDTPSSLSHLHLNIKSLKSINFPLKLQILLQCGPTIYLDPNVINRVRKKNTLDSKVILCHSSTYTYLKVLHPL